MRFFMLFLVLMIAVPLLAQENSSVPRERISGAMIIAEEISDFPKSGLEFSVRDNLTLAGIDGLAAAWTRRSSATRGWRFGLDLYARRTESSSTSELLSWEKTNRLDLRFITQKLYLTEPRNGASLIFGIGPFTGVSLYEGEETSQRFDYGSLFIRDEWTWSVGLASDLGIEWQLLDQLSMGARYHWGIQYAKTDGHRSETFSGIEPYERNYESEIFEFFGVNSVDLLVTFWY